MPQATNREIKILYRVLTAQDFQLLSSVLCAVCCVLCACL